MLNRSNQGTLAIPSPIQKPMMALVERTSISQAGRARVSQSTSPSARNKSRPAAAGMYLYQLESGGIQEVKRMTLVR